MTLHQAIAANAANGPFQIFICCAIAIVIQTIASLNRCCDLPLASTPCTGTTLLLASGTDAHTVRIIRIRGVAFSKEILICLSVAIIVQSIAGIVFLQHGIGGAETGPKSRYGWIAD
jgi:hypothetical protein